MNDDDQPLHGVNPPYEFLLHRCIIVLQYTFIPLKYKRRPAKRV